MSNIDLRIIPDSTTKAMPSVRTLMRTCAISFAVRSCIHQTTTSTLNMATDKKEFEYHYDFELRVNACDSYGEIWASGANANERARLIHVCIDVKNLCEALCEEALTYLHTVKKEQLANHRVRIVDVAKYCQLIDDTRRNSS